MLDFIKIKNCALKNTIEKVKRQLRMGENICNSNI